MHPHLAKTTFGVKPRRHGPKHLAPVLPEPLQARRKGGALVQGPCGTLASINGEANTLEGPNTESKALSPTTAGTTTMLSSS